MTLLDLPSELIIQILSNLTHKDLISCQLSNSTLYTVIKDSVLLQFRIALSTFKATDNPSCPLSIPERSKALKDSEEAWTSLREKFRRRITVNHEPSNIFNLTGGVFSLGNAARTALHYIKLPFSAEDEVEWQKVQLDPSEGTIINMGFCLHEHDLLAVVTTKSAQIPPITDYDINIVLLKFSTGKPHPAARQSTIHVLSSEWKEPETSIEIVGDHLVLILTYHNLMSNDRVFVYDWRNAVQKMSVSVTQCSYHTLTFLSENIFLVPNTLTNTLDIWDILSNPESPRPVCILQLPELVEGSSLTYITCRGEPKPIGCGSRLQSDRPFHQSSEDAIILFQICAANLVHRYAYKFFIHRKALLEICDQRRAKIEESRFRVEDVNSGLSKLVIEDTTTIAIPWSSWGPPVTRWFYVRSARWITNTAGQRGVLVHPTHRQYVVLDFNPENLRRAENKLRSSSLTINNRIHCCRSWETLQIDDVFQDPVLSKLPFVAYTLENAHAWDGALMDEERVLGLQVHDRCIRAIEIRHFG